MKIGVISDTHTRTMEDIPWSLLDAMKDVDLILHAGDITERSVLEELRELGEVKAVYGNMDSIELKRMLPDKRTIDIAGKQIGQFTAPGGRGTWRKECGRCSARWTSSSSDTPIYLSTSMYGERSCSIRGGPGTPTAS